MKKLHIFGLMALAVAGLTSCEADKDPVLQEPTEFKVNTPPFINQLYDLSPEGVMEVTCSQPNYGLALAPSYNAEVSIYPDFGASLPAPDPNDKDAIPYSVIVAPNDPFSAVMEIPENALAVAICEMRGIIKEEDYTPEPPRPLYMRIIAQIAKQPSTRIVSDVLTFPQVQGYFATNLKELDVVYTPGPSNGWNFEKCQQLFAYDENKYHGFMYIVDEFKFTSAPNWDAGNWGSADASGELVNNSGVMEQGSGTNFKVPQATGNGLYFADVNTKDLTFTITYVTSVGAIGDYNGWDVNGGHMTSDDFLHWKLKADFGGEFKFLFNGNWKFVNLGEAIDDLEFGGANMVAEPGEKTLVLDLSKLPYTATFE